jgi:preprotein translocase subunit SecE
VHILKKKEMAVLIEFVKESYVELMTKVTWPSLKDLQSSSILVLVTSVIIALLIFAMDYVFGINSGDVLWKGVLGFVYDLI